jgi:uncharacterized protein YqgC (DUF456 family)
MEWWDTLLEGLGYYSLVGVVWLLCAVGVILSVLSISGTWLVLLASLILMLIRGDAFPGWVTVAFFAVVCVVVEVLDTVAGSLGVKRTGGSKASVWAAFFAGIVGMFVGGALIPVIGSVIGMLVFSFVVVYYIEKRDMEKTGGDAARVATATVVARVLVVLLKLIATFAMIIWLICGVLAD